MRLVVISRPIVWLPTAGLYLGGVVMSADSSLTWAVLWGLLYFTLPVGIVVYGLNDISDRESDAQNDRKGTVNGAVISDKEVRFITWAVALSTIIFFVPYAVTGHYWAAVGVLVQLLLAYVYSMRPFHLKGRPGLDLLSVAIVVIACVMSGLWTNVTGWGIPGWLPVHIVVVLALCAAAVHAVPEVLDYEVDKKMGDKTIAVVIGKRATLCMCAAFLAVCIPLVKVHSTAVQAYFIYATVCTALVALTNKRPAIFALVIALIMPVPVLAAYVFIVR